MENVVADALSRITVHHPSRMIQIGNFAMISKELSCISPQDWVEYQREDEGLAKYLKAINEEENAPKSRNVNEHLEVD